MTVRMISLIIYLLIVFMIWYLKPSFLFNRDGSFRQFGIGYKEKTILPIWLFFIIAGLLSYIGVMYWRRFF